MNTGFFGRNKAVFLYGAAMALLVFLLKWLEIKFLIVNHAIELYIGIVALMFTGLGIWLALKLAKPKVKVETVLVEREVTVEVKGDFEVNGKEVERLGLSKREMEVLELMSKGFSNQEIAEKLFVSLNTIKTHSSRLYEKLEVKRRTQAVEKAKRKGLIP